MKPIMESIMTIFIKIKKQILIILSIVLVAGCGGKTQDLEEIKSKIETNFPQVNHISAEVVANWLKEDESKTILLDIREKDEYNISHLPNAYNVPPDTSIEKLQETILKNLESDRKIVLYCSVGLRSAIFTQKLQDAGFTNVYNFNGSIFEWANLNKPVYQGDGLVKKVHPYDEKWGKFLQPQLREDLSNLESREN